MNSVERKGMPAEGFLLLCVLVLAIAFGWVPTYTVMSPLDLAISIGMLTFPLIIARAFLKDGAYKNLFCLLFLCAAIYVHPFVVTNLGGSGATNDYPGEHNDGAPHVGTYDQNQAFRQMLLRDSFDLRLGYVDRTKKGLELSRWMRRETLESFRRYQPVLFWMYPPSLALLFLGCVLYFFGFRFPKARD